MKESLLGLGIVAGIVGLIGTAGGLVSKLFANSNIDYNKRILIFDYGVDSAAIGETKTSFFTPVQNEAIVKRLRRMKDSVDIKAKHPSWDTAKITSSLNCLRK